MNHDYPYSSLRAASRTLFGRPVLVALAALLGSMLAGLTAYRTPWGIWGGLIGFPQLTLHSLADGHGQFVLPFLLVFTVLSIYFAWPLRLTLVCSLLMWWNIHKTIRWMEFDSPEAVARKQTHEALFSKPRGSPAERT